SVPTHTPDAHASAVVHSLPSLQAAPSMRAMASHAPVSRLHAPTLHSPSRSLQSRTEQGSSVQVPFTHASAVVSGSPSSHSVPLSTGVAAHSPDSGSQVPALHMSSSVEQSRCVSLRQRPARQLSAKVHGLPSSQGSWSASGTPRHSPAWQVSLTEHGL